MKNLGVGNMFLVCGFVNLAISMLFVPMILFGKKMRKLLAGRYDRMVEEQHS
jgi:hypothetical protein